MRTLRFPTLIAFSFFCMLTQACSSPNETDAHILVRQYVKYTSWFLSQNVDDIQGVKLARKKVYAADGDSCNAEAVCDFIHKDTTVRGTIYFQLTKQEDGWAIVKHAMAFEDDSIVWNTMPKPVTLKTLREEEASRSQISTQTPNDSKNTP